MKLILFIGFFGPCTQIHCAINNFELIKSLNRTLVEPIIFSHSHSSNTLPYLKLFDILKNNKFLNIVNNQVLKKINFNTINHYILCPDETNNEMEVVYKPTNHSYQKSLLEYYNLEISKVNCIVNDLKKLQKDTSEVIILSSYKAHKFYKWVPFQKLKPHLKINSSIEQITRKYILNTFGKENYLSIQIRRINDREEAYRDWRHYFGFSFEDLYNRLINICKRNQIPYKNIFVSVKPKILRLYRKDIFFDKIKVYSDDNNPKEIQYYVEQYIASQAKILIFTKGSEFSNMVVGLSNKRKTKCIDIATLKYVNKNQFLCVRKYGIK